MSRSSISASVILMPLSAHCESAIGRTPQVGSEADCRAAPHRAFHVNARRPLRGEHQDSPPKVFGSYPAGIDGGAPPPPAAAENGTALHAIALFSFGQRLRNLA